jgi:regulator of protease activity HflC (stomatin/prohibitin superfamily)
MSPEERAMATAVDHVTADQMAGTQEFEGWAIRGELVAGAIVVAGLAGVALIIFGGTDAAALAGIVLLVLAGLVAPGLTVVQPNEGKVLILFGRYTGTIRRPGLSWVNPLTIVWRASISLRVRNFQTERSKVNDATGSPIIIAAVIVWKVVDTGRAMFDVEDFEHFVVVQSETAVRHLATQYPYDDFDEGTASLRGNADEVSRTLHGELQDRLAGAGIVVLETRLTHLAYAPEIAEAMLRRQQAAAIVAARQTIVAGAVGLVDMALERISAEGIVELDEERKAAMVSNLMVVLTGDRAPTPVINAGTLYSG